MQAITKCSGLLEPECLVFSAFYLQESQHIFCLLFLSTFHLQKSEYLGFFFGVELFPTLHFQESENITFWFL